LERKLREERKLKEKMLFLYILTYVKNAVKAKLGGRDEGNPYKKTRYPRSKTYIVPVENGNKVSKI